MEKENKSRREQIVSEYTAIAEAISLVGILVIAAGILIKEGAFTDPNTIYGVGGILIGISLLRNGTERYLKARRVSSRIKNRNN